MSTSLLDSELSRLVLKASLAADCILLVAFLFDMQVLVNNCAG